jgi:hypothetical protein
MQMCRPITKALFRVDADLAVKTFLSAEKFYHPIARAQLRKVSTEQAFNLPMLTLPYRTSNSSRLKACMLGGYDSSACRLISILSELSKYIE